MKETLVLLCLLNISLFASSQLTRGNWLAGGSGSLYSFNQNSHASAPINSVQFKYLNVDISASIGYFISNKIALGLRPAFSWQKGKAVGFTGNASGGNTNTKRYEIGPFGRYYFLNINKQFNIVGDVSYQYGIVDFKDTRNGHSTKFTILTGPVVYFNSSVGLEILLGYSSRNELYGPYKEYMKGFLATIGLQVHLERD
jgi:hypothetical protein